MARVTPLLNNAIRHPATIVRMLTMHPHTLRDETTESLQETAKALVRAGHREDLMGILDRAGLDDGRRAAVMTAVSGHRVH